MLQIQFYIGRFHMPSLKSSLSYLHQNQPYSISIEGKLVSVVISRGLVLVVRGNTTNSNPSQLLSFESKPQGVIFCFPLPDTDS